MILMSALTVTLFLGGWLPIIDVYPLNEVPGVIWFIIKIIFILFIFYGLELLHQGIDMTN